MEKQNFNRKTLHTLELNNSTRIIHQDTILKHEQEFYADLYHTRMEELPPKDDYLGNISSARLTLEEKLLLDEDLVLEEIIEAIKAMKNKVPGMDALQIEFYKQFLPILAPFLL